MKKEPRGTDEQEREIGARERVFDLARDRVAGLERAVEGLKKTSEAQYARVVNDRLVLQISRAEKELTEARAALVEAESRMREGHGWRTAKSAPGE
ncbi:MAG: hypothetical protein WB780_21230 [Candidatus Acidiferrales bacterium]